MKYRKEKNFFSMFNEKTGQYLRSGIICNGKDTGKDPFMASFPELLDIGIMGHCEHGKSGLCIKAGVECYQNGLNSNAPNMTLDDFEIIAKQCKGNTYQFALGGCGDPDQHEDFEKILEICKKYEIVPNFTTSGLGMTDEIADLCMKYCGAVAVSWYRSNYTLVAIDTLLNHEVKTNIHYVLSKDTIFEAIDRLENDGFPHGINAIVFLLHKPVGLGSREKDISAENKDFKKLVALIANKKYPYRIGFDSCTVPGLLNLSSSFDLDSLDTCEGARWSAYISADMKMMPCSFDNQKQRWAVDLRKSTIEDAWYSLEFESFRNCFRSACPNCDKREYCMGGCPIVPEVVLCGREERTKTV